MLSTWDRWLEASEMAKESCAIETDANMKANGRTIWGTGEALRGTQIATHISVSFKTEKLMGKVSTLGTTVKFMMVNGTRVSSTATESGEVSQVILTLVSGDILKQKASVCTLGKTGIAMRENGANVWSMVKAQTSSRMETLIQENTKKVSQMEKASTHGKMVLSMSENFV